ncbi:BrnT family toxin [Gammaproteobacteria bacterium]
MDIHYELNGELFVWNEHKAEKNWRRHGVRFEEAATVFADPLFVLVDASRRDEARDAAIGFDLTGRLLYVVHIEVEASFIRIISARRAEPEEERCYVV